MSKRISNKKGSSRKTPARSRVKFGWRKRSTLEALKKLDVSKSDDEQIQAYLHSAKQTLGRFFPSRLFRHQSR